MLGRILWLLVWIVANVVYGNMVRDGQRGFRRLTAFYLGWPGTFLSYLSIQPRRRVAEPQMDAGYRSRLELEEERDLLVEIRRDRAQRISRSRGGEEGVVDEEA